MKKSIILLGVLASGLAYSQIGRVGVNTESPRATFEVTPAAANAVLHGTTNEGILIPKLSNERLENIAEANLVDGTLVYVDSIGSYTKSTVSEVIDHGFYYYSKRLNKWIKLTTSNDQDLRLVGSNNHITQDAGVGGNGISVGTGGYNIAIGSTSLSSNTTGNHNIAIGRTAMSSNTNGTQNISLGINSMQQNTRGSDNIAIGSSALLSNTTGNHNIAIGSSSMENATASRYNIAIGGYSLYSNTTGQYNVAIGSSALNLNTTGNHNIALGNYSLSSNTIGVNNIAMGSRALYSNTTGNINISLGNNSLYSNTTGTNNIALGNNSLNRNTTGGGNIGLGNSVLLSNTTGSNNVGMGLNSLRNNTTGINNVGTGVSTLFSNTTGSQNMAYGTETLYRNTTGQYNVGFGYRAIYNNVGGDSNVALGGNQSGAWIKGNSNVHIGNGLFQSASTAELDNVIAIGNGLSSTELTATTGQDNTIILGYKNGHNFSPKVGIGTYKPTEKVHIVANGPAIRIEDTNQAAGRVLTSDANGVGTWKDVKMFSSDPELGKFIWAAHTPLGNRNFNTIATLAIRPGTNMIHYKVHLLARQAPTTNNPLVTNVRLYVGLKDLGTNNANTGETPIHTAFHPYLSQDFEVTGTFMYTNPTNSYQWLYLNLQSDEPTVFRSRFEREQGKAKSIYKGTEWYENWFYAIPANR